MASRPASLLQPFAHDNTCSLFETQVLVEADNLSIRVPDEELRLQDASLAQPTFRRLYHLSSDPFSLDVGRGSNIIKPTPMTVISDHYGSYDPLAFILIDQHVGT